MEKLYFANKIMLIEDFIRYAKYKKEQLGCENKNYYYLDNRIYALKLQDGKYIDLSGNEYQEFNKKDMKSKNIIWCNDCKYNNKKSFSTDCQETPITSVLCVGITNIELLTNFLKYYDPEKVMKIIDKFNNDIGAYYTYIDSKEYDNSISKVNNKVRKYLKK